MKLANYLKIELYESGYNEHINIEFTFDFLIQFSKLERDDIFLMYFYVLWGISIIFSVVLRNIFKNIFIDNLIIRIALAIITALVAVSLKIYISRKQKQQLIKSLAGINYEIVNLKMIYLKPVDAIKCNLRNLFGYIYLLSMPTIGLVLIIISNETIPMIIFLISLSAYFILSNATIPGLKPKNETLNITFVEV